VAVGSAAMGTPETEVASMGVPERTLAGAGPTFITFATWAALPVGASIEVIEAVPYVADSELVVVSVQMRRGDAVGLLMKVGPKLGRGTNAMAALTCSPLIGS